MRKPELVTVLAEKSEVSKKDVEKVLNALQDTITETLKAGDKIQIVGFGTVELRKKAARDGINPLTKEKCHYEAKNVPFVKFGSSYKEKFN